MIPQDRSRSAAVEIDKVLDDLLPLLQAVEAGRSSNATLNALATALQGRGEQIGRNLDWLDGYLRKINPDLPTLVHDLHGAGRRVGHLPRGRARPAARRCATSTSPASTIADKRRRSSV